MRPEAHGLPRALRRTPIRNLDLKRGLFHVVIFGPGVGEASVLVFPDGSIGIVDGCREPEGEEGQGDPVHEFLAAMPTPPRIRFVCLTHPHDDHYGGLGALINSYRDYIEELWTVPLEQDRLREALQETAALLFPAATPDRISKLRGLERIVGEVAAAVAQQGGPRVRHLVANAELLFEESVASAPLLIHACGPAQEDLPRMAMRAQHFWHCLLREEVPPPELDPNRTSGALRIRWGKAGILLTGDLLTGDVGASSGWNAIAAMLNRTGEPIHLWNAAHHGSVGAHHDGLWEHHAVSLAVVTPFKRASGTMPPRPERIAHLARTASVILTAEPAWLAANDPAHPRRLTPDAHPGYRPLSRSGGLDLCPTPAPRDIDNAVAVSLDVDGNIVQVLLSGKADFYICDGPSAG